MTNPSDQSAEPIDHDQNFKELISTFFWEFLELFLPDLAKDIDPDSIRFLPQEYFAALAIALLHFTSINDLSNWLNVNE